MRDLSVIITARNEEFLKRTVDDVLNKRRANTEVIVILDGAPDNPKLDDHKDVTILSHHESVGQRAAINEGVNLSSAKFIMKLDAHCILDEGFDVKLMKDCEYNWTVIPAQFNLHSFNWKCKECGNEWYQGPTPTHCQKPGEGKGRNMDCKSKEFERKMVWKPRPGRKTVGWRFDSNLKFGYWGGLKHRPGNEGHLMDTLSFLGACFFMHRDWYWELGGSEESWGSWGQQGTEISCKTWLSGGRLVTNKNTWFAHLFRTQGGDFGFPYKQDNNQVKNARNKSREFFVDGKWKSKHKLSWLIEKFWPIPGWDEKDLIAIGGSVMKSKTQSKEKGGIFYTDNQLNLRIAHKAQSAIKKSGIPIVSSSLKPMSFGDKNIVLDRKRGYLTMFKQILAALEALETKYVFFLEHDVIYHPSHFDFTPPKDEVWYYNVNMWKVNAETGACVRTDDCKQVSGICVNRETAVKHYQKRVAMTEDRIRKHGDHEFNKWVRKMGFEPGTHRRPERVDDSTAKGWVSKYPNMDIRHSSNLTSTRWSPEQFVNKKYTKGWTVSDITKMEGWKTEDFDFLKLG
jgi:glycosyltransferase involved in cell wall biosynthesis